MALMYIFGVSLADKEERKGCLFWFASGFTLLLAALFAMVAYGMLQDLMA